MNKLTIKLTGAILAGAILMSSTKVFASHNYTYLKQQLTIVGYILGFQVTNLYTYTIEDQKEHYIPVYLRRGTEYLIEGVCDDNCNDLDLKLYNDSGNLITYDNSSEKAAAVSYTPRFSGNYRIHIIMSSCSLYFCDYGVGIFTR
jgi:hypothetical protein